MGLLDWTKKATTTLSATFTKTSHPEEDIKELDRTLKGFISDSAAPLLSQLSDDLYKRASTAINTQDTGSDSFASLVQGVLHANVEAILYWDAFLEEMLNVQLKEKSLLDLKSYYETNALPSDYRAIIAIGVLEKGSQVYDQLIQDIRDNPRGISSERIEEFDRMWTLAALTKETETRGLLRSRVLLLLRNKQFYSGGAATLEYLSGVSEMESNRSAMLFRKAFMPTFVRMTSSDSGTALYYKLKDELHHWQKLKEALFPAISENNRTHTSAAGAFLGLWIECEDIKQEVTTNIMSRAREEIGDFLDALELKDDVTSEHISRIVDDKFNPTMNDAMRILHSLI